MFLSIDIFFCLAFLEYSSLHTVIMYHVFIASRRPQAFKEDTDSTDATDLFFHGFLFDAFGLCAPLAHGFLRIFLRLRQSSAVRRKEIRNKSKSKWNPWKDKIRRIGFIRDRFWTLAKEPIGSWALMGRNINKQKPKIQ